jgi:hypothetical protein
MQAGGTVTAKWRSNDTHLDLFVTGPDGAVWSTFWEANGGWRPWFVIHPEQKMQPGAAVTALWRSNETHLDLFVTGPDGAVWSTFWEANGGWRPWFVIHPEQKMQPGATITALWRANETHLDLFVTGTDGAVWSTFWEANGGWRPWFSISTETRARTHACATLLPTGDVLLTGGAAPDNDQIGIMEPELYNTPLDRRQGRYSGGTGTWQTIADPATVLRNYHSTALLMPDGRVWTAGGNSANQPGQPPTPIQKQIEIYEPPYPPGPRPRITTCPPSTRYGSQFTVGVPSATAIMCMVLMRCGSSTHAFDGDQRAVLLRFQTTGANTLVATAPPSGAVAPPGPYMLFVVDDGGRPCEYAKFITLSGQQ